jgi:hypothetical protein
MPLFIQGWITYWKSVYGGSSIDRRDSIYGICLIASLISLVLWGALYILLPALDASNPPTPTNWGVQGLIGCFILLPLIFIRFFAMLLFGFGGAFTLFVEKRDRSLGILALVAGSAVVSWILPWAYFPLGDFLSSSSHPNVAELPFVVVSFGLGLWWFGKGRKQMESVRAPEDERGDHERQTTEAESNAPPST